MEGSCLTGQSPQWAVVPVEEKEELCKFNTCKMLNYYPIREKPVYFQMFSVCTKYKYSVTERRDFTKL
jgi:hypothetical protein